MPRALHGCPADGVTLVTLPLVGAVSVWALYDVSLPRNTCNGRSFGYGVQVIPRLRLRLYLNGRVEKHMGTPVWPASVV